MSDHDFAEISHTDLAMDIDPPDKAEIISKCFDSMRAGSTLNRQALLMGYSPATIWRWLHTREDWVKAYEQLKVERSRALIEHALYELQTADGIEKVKIAERRAKYYLMMAGKLNPHEFSDRMHSPTHVQALGKGRVTFVLNMGGAPAQSMGELTVIEQPEDGS